MADNPSGLPDRRSRGGSGLVGSDNSISPMAVLMILGLVAAAGIFVFSLSRMGSMGRDVPRFSFSGDPTPVPTAVPESPFGSSGSPVSDSVSVVPGLPAGGREAVGWPSAGPGSVGWLSRGPVILGGPLALWGAVGCVLGSALVGGGLLYGRRWGITAAECVSYGRGLMCRSSG